MSRFSQSCHVMQWPAQAVIVCVCVSMCVCVILSSSKSSALVIFQGYGLTETCAASFLAGPFPGHSGTVGPPVPGTEYRLEGSSELG